MTQHLHRFQNLRRVLDHSLNCDSVREQLEALADGEVGPRLKQRVLDHLDSCAGCRRAREEHEHAQSRARLALEGHPRIAAPPGFDARVWASIEARRLERERELACAPFMERLGLFALRPVPRLLGSAVFGLLTALAFGFLAVSVPASGSNSGSASAPVSILFP